MMKYEEIVESIKDILVTNSNSEFRVIGRKQAQDVICNKAKNRSVQVFCIKGVTDRGTRLKGPFDTDIKIALQIQASESSKINMSAINNGTTQQIIDALIQKKESIDLATKSANKVFEYIYEIIMNAERYHLGIEDEDNTHRLISEWNISEPLDMGEFVQVEINAILETTVSQPVGGKIPLTAIYPIHSVKTDIYAQNGDGPDTAITIIEAGGE